MNKVLINIPLLLLLAVLVLGVSIYVDIGETSFVWLQRSGSFLVLIGAILSYRSIVRLGVEGVGGPVSSGISMGTVIGSYDDDETGLPMLKIEYSEETIQFEREMSRDKLSGYIGAFLLVFGTVIWGYGDLLGQIF